jgi:glycosyltransferase involved in cell wall biosynthesis
MRILFFIEGKDTPSSRFRVQQFIPYFKKLGIKCKLIQGHPHKTYYVSYHNLILKRVVNSFLYFVKALTIIAQMPLILWADIVFLQRPLIHHNFIFLEKILYWFKKPIIFDIDDALFLKAKDPDQYEEIFVKLSQGNFRLNWTIKKAQYVLAGNKFLANYCKKYNNNTKIIPTVINTDRYRAYFNISGISNIQKTKGKLIIGWMGTSTNLDYLVKYLDVFGEIRKMHPQTILMISTNNFFYKKKINKAIPTQFIKWSKENELQTLYSFDIGIMPLPNEPWVKGKCGFKLIQYMACGIPSIGSNIGANKEIINDGSNGYLARGKEEWVQKISTLLKDVELRKKFSKQGRKKIEQNYSIKSVLPEFITIFIKCLKYKEERG